MNHFDLIEAYAHGELPEEDMRAFESRLTQDASFRDEWEKYSMAKQLSGVLAYHDAKARISKLTSPLSVSHKRPAGRRLMQIAAVLLILIIVAVGYSNLSYSNSALASNFYTSASQHMRSPRTDGAARLIDDHKYTEAIDLLRKADPTDIQARTLLAEALAKSGETKEAIVIYMELAENPSNVNRDAAQFALAVLYLKSGDFEIATELVDRIASNETHDYRFEARDLRHKLDSPWRKLVL